MSVDQSDTLSLASSVEAVNEASRQWRRPAMRRLDLAEAELTAATPSADGITGKDLS